MPSGSGTMFTEKSGKYVCNGGFIECRQVSLVIRATIVDDGDRGPPDTRDEGFWNNASEWEFV